MRDDPNEVSIPSSPDLTNLTKPFLFIIFAIAACLVVLNVTYLWLQTSNPGETSNPESLFIYHAVNLSEGKDLYPDFRKPPYNVTQYTPFYYWLLSQMKQLANLDVQQLFIWGRRLALLFAFGIALLVFVYGKAETQNSFLSVTAALIFLGSYLLWPVACTNRSDIPGAFFAIAAFTLFGVRKNYWLALPLLVLSFYIKQSFLSAPAAIAIYFLIQRQYLHFIRFSLVFVLVTGFIWILLHLVSDGMSTLNLVDANLAPFSFRNTRLVSSLFFQTAALPLILSFSGLNGKLRDRPAAIYFIVSLLWALITSAKLGSNLNYFVEALAAGCLLIPKALQQAITNHGWSRRVVLAVFLVFAIPQINFVANGVWSLKFTVDASARKLAYSAAGFVISDNPRISISARKPFMIDPFAYSYLESEGKWNSSQLLSMIQSGQVQYFILLSPLERPLTWQGAPRLPRSVIRTALKEFKQTGVIDNYFIYEKR